MNRRMGGNLTPPVQVGEELDVKIEAVGEKGDGIAKKDGFVLFVPGVKEGDEVKVRVTKVLRKVGFAEVVGAKKQGEAPEGTSEKEYTTPEAAEEEPAEEQSAEDSDSFGEDASSEEEPESDMPSLEEEPSDDEAQ